MKINLLSSNEERCLTILGQVSEKDKQWLADFTDHAVLKKTDVNFNANEKILTVKLRRHEENTKAKKRIFKAVLWDNSVLPTKDCHLIIKDIGKCIIENKDTDTKEINDVIIGGVLIKDSEIYIGSACRHENDYGIALSVSRINISLEDGEIGGK